jgi:hypothetical protein
MSAVQDVQMFLHDSGVFWPTAQVVDALNEAQLQVFVQTKWKKTSVTLSMNTGDDVISIPPSILVPQYIEDSTTRYFPTTQVELERCTRAWRGEGLNAPEVFVLWDATHLRCWPRPDQPYDLTLWGLGWPTTQTSTSDLEGPEMVKLAILNLATALCLDATRPDLAELYRMQGEEQILKVKKLLRNNQSHNIQRLRPGTKIDIQKAGVRVAPVTFYPRII